MADSAITAFTAATSMKLTDLLYTVIDPAGTPLDRKLPFSLLAIQWYEVDEAWTYASATTVNVPTGATARFVKGWRVRFKQGAGYKYYVCTTVAAALLTLDGGTDYTVANAAISDIAVSPLMSPLDFPEYFNFTPSWTNLTVGSGTTIARKRFIGSICEVDIYFTFAADSSVGGHITLAVPGGGLSAGSSYSTPVGQVNYSDGGTFYNGMARIASSTTLTFYVGKSDGTYLNNAATSATVPFSWTTNDRIEAHLSYLWT